MVQPQRIGSRVAATPPWGGARTLVLALAIALINLSIILLSTTGSPDDVPAPAWQLGLPDQPADPAADRAPDPSDNLPWR